MEEWKRFSAQCLPPTSSVLQETRALLSGSYQQHLSVSYRALISLIKIIFLRKESKTAISPTDEFMSRNKTTSNKILTDNTLAKMSRNHEWISCFPLKFTKVHCKPSYISEPNWSPKSQWHTCFSLCSLCGVYSSAAPWEPLTLVFWLFHWDLGLATRTTLRARESHGPTCHHSLCTRIASVHPHSLHMGAVVGSQQLVWSALFHLSPLPSPNVPLLQQAQLQGYGLLLKFCPKNLPTFITIPEHYSYITWQEFQR